MMLSAESRCACCLWPMTTHVRRLVQTVGHFFKESILTVSNVKAGFAFFSMSSALLAPIRLMGLGLLPFATKNTRGGVFLRLNLCATLLPLSVWSQQDKTPTFRPILLLKLRAESSNTLGSRWFCVSLLTQYTSHGTPPKRTSFSLG